MCPRRWVTVLLPEMQALRRSLLDLVADAPPSDTVLTSTFMDLLVAYQTRVFTSPPGHRCERTRGVTCSRLVLQAWLMLHSAGDPRLGYLAAPRVVTCSCESLFRPAPSSGSHDADSKLEDCVEREEKSSAEEVPSPDGWLQVTVPHANALVVALDPKSHLPPGRALFAKVRLGPLLQESCRALSDRVGNTRVCRADQVAQEAAVLLSRRLHASSTSQSLKAHRLFMCCMQQAVGDAGEGVRIHPESPSPLVLESDHPYLSHTAEVRHVYFSGATSISITFDPETRTEAG